MSNQVDNGNKKPEKKKSHLKAKIITVLILIVLLIGIGIYIGFRFYRAYISFSYRMTRSMFSFSIWGMVIIGVILILLVLYLVFKLRRR